jgi:hypothetical protein
VCVTKLPVCHLGTPNGKAQADKDSRMRCTSELDPVTFLARALLFQ